MPDQPKPNPADDKTIPSRPESLRRIVAQSAQSAATAPSGTPAGNASGEAGKNPAANLPWMLAQYFNGDIDLSQELTGRFPQMPLMSQINFRAQGTKTKHHIAMISTQDGAANLRIEIDGGTRATFFTFTLNSMLALRFGLNGLSDLDRNHWIEPMKRESGEVAFLWGAQRFRSDYLITVPQKLYTNLFAFSPLHTEAAARLTIEASRKLMAWLEPLWASNEDTSSSGTPTPTSANTSSW